METTPSKRSGPIKIIGSKITAFGSLALLLAASGCATALQYDQNLASQIKDRGISYRVSAALEDDTSFRYRGIRVETMGGIVELRGFAKSQNQMDRAGDLAKRVKGVREVTNNIEVKESIN